MSRSKDTDPAAMEARREIAIAELTRLAIEIGDEVVQAPADPDKREEEKAMVRQLAARALDLLALAIEAEPELVLVEQQRVGELRARLRTAKRLTAPAEPERPRPTAKTGPAAAPRHEQPIENLVKRLEAAAESAHAVAEAAGAANLDGGPEGCRQVAQLARESARAVADALDAAEDLRPQPHCCICAAVVWLRRTWSTALAAARRRLWPVAEAA